LEEKFDLVVTGGQVVLTGGIVATVNIGIKGEKITALTEHVIEAEEEVDASGKVVIPGLIDEHFHVFCGYGCETWENATCAAARGGVTTVVKMPLDKPPTTTAEELERSIDRAKNSAYVDHAFWGGVDPENPTGIASQAELGVVGYKLFVEGAAPPGMYPTLDAGQMLDALRKIAALKATAIVHAENGLIANLLGEELKSQGLKHPDVWSDARPEIAELEGVSRTVLLAEATGCRAIIAHVSLPRALKIIAEARANGAHVFAETCPHYLLLTRDHLAKDKRLKWNPPCRTRNQVGELWDLLEAGFVDAIASDHGPFTKDDHLDIWNISAGAGNIVEIMLPLIFTEAVVNRGISLTKIIELMSARPARTLGLYPKKGAICVGADADLVIVDMSTKRAINAEELCYIGSHWSAFDRWTVKAIPTTTILRGQIIMKNNKVITKPGYGQRILPKGNSCHGGQLFS